MCLIEVSWTLDLIKHFLLLSHIQAIQVDTKNKYFRDFMMVSKKLNIKKFKYSSACLNIDSKKVCGYFQ